MSTIVITGGATGIGMATARIAAGNGYHVAIASLADTMDEANTLVDELQAQGSKAVALTTDITVEEEVVEFFRRAEADLGPVSGLVNAAGLIYSADCTELEADKVAALMAVNVTGLMLCSREAARSMMGNENNGGSIVNVSSMGATIGGRARGACYAASKAAVDSFTTGMAKEVAKWNIRVNAVRPGLIDTGMTSEILNDPRRKKSIEESIPIGRVGRAHEVSEAIMWLMSDKASWISGAHLDISGGGFHVTGSF
ncbi:SDR family NAD(P)-dependent oxidoreductase [Crystallibacter degradans]|uniref:SDR family NAD(P)-dependent oxidoreductase n=1 Tax=Crystallibacter degradans TaxID=2726743 RepID=UPI001472FFF5|nr:SDR family oxidoreductase [Arthrobacter sp. SF27]NMR32088.1 SDR family oxidoreductase [Arthrobacter sp. SF27]